MGGFKKININDDIERITLEIVKYIKEHSVELPFNIESVRRVLIENYIYILTYKNEYAANDFLIKIESNLSLYNRDKFTKAIDFIVKEINASIENLFVNNSYLTNKNYQKLNKIRINSVFQHYPSGSFHLKIEDKNLFIQIDNTNQLFKIIDFEGTVEFFSKKDDLIHTINQMVKNSVADNSISYRFYAKNEYFNFFTLDKYWQVTPKDIYAEVINDIKAKKQVHIDSHLTVELIDSYSYKNIFIVRDSKENSEKILHIYLNNIDEAFLIAVAKHRQLKENGEHLLYKLDKDWFFTKMRDKSVKYFSQTSDLLIPLEKIMGRINLVASAETNYNFSHFDPLSGVCYGISLKYLLEVRNNGIEGGNKYLHWLKENINLYKDKKEKISDKLEKIIFDSVQEYELLKLIKEIKEIKFAQIFQMERIYEKINYTIFDLTKATEYRKILAENGLKASNANRLESSLSQINYHLEYIMQYYNEYYAIIAFKTHAIALAYKRYSNNHYKFTLFDSNSELAEFSNIESIKDALIKTMGSYTLNKADGKEYFIIDEYKKNPTTKYRSLWDQSEIELHKGIAENIKKIGFSLPFKDGVVGRVIHYSEQRELILELKINSKLVEVVVKNVFVDEGIFLVKNNLDKILENNKSSKVIIMNNSDGIDIQFTEFNTHQKMSKPKGYLEFNDVYYRDLIKINSYLLNGKKSFSLNKIVSLIDTLRGNIYFDKITASFSIIDEIILFNQNNESISLVDILNQVKKKIEDKLFYGDLLYGKEKLIALAQKNSLVAAIFYRMMVNEINEGYTGISNFIYEQIIDNPFLILDKNRNVGVVGYDYTINFKNNYKTLKEIIDGIDISEIKNLFLLDDENRLHLKLTYQRLSEYRNNKYVNKLLHLIEDEIDSIKKADDTGIYRDLYFEFFSNHQFNNRVIIHEIAQLESYFNNNYQERNYGYHPSNFYINENDPLTLLEKSFNQNKNEIDGSYLLFNESKENFDFLFVDNNFITRDFVDNIVIESISGIYQDDIVIYFYNGVKSEQLTQYLKDKPEIGRFLDYCLKHKIRVIAAGNEEYFPATNVLVKQKNRVESLQNVILQHQFVGERTIVFANKETLFSYQSGHLFIEGIAQRLNMPIYTVTDNSLILENEYIMVRPTTESQFTGHPLLADTGASNTLLTETVPNEPNTNSNRQRVDIENKKYAVEIYQFVSHNYTNYRDNQEFKLGYQNEISTIFPDYSDNMTIADILNYIQLNRYQINYAQLGAIIRKVDQINLKYHKEKLAELSDKIINHDLLIDNVIEKYLVELSAIFNTSDNSLIKRNLIQSLYDPSVNKEFNQFLMDGTNFEQWQEITNKDYRNYNLTERTYQVIELIHAIYDTPLLIDNLSELSKNRLNAFFDKDNKGILSRVLLNTISSFELYKETINNLKKLAVISQSNEEISALSPVEALNKLNEFKGEVNLATSEDSSTISSKVEINNLVIDKRLLCYLGAKINGESIDAIDLNQIENWDKKITFDPQHLNDYFLSVTGNEKDKEVIALLRYLLNNKQDKIKYFLSHMASRADYVAAHERLMKIIALGSKQYNQQDWENLRIPSLKIPRHMRVISKIGYANISFGMWQSINSTFMLAEQLNNPLLTPQEHKETINNLAITWSEMAYNGLSEVIEIALAKGLLKYRNNPLEYISKTSTRIGIGLNILSIGFDIYNIYDNFSRISVEKNEKRRIDYIVNGSLAIVSGLVTLGVSIAMLAGSTVAGPIGIVAGAVIALAISIYNAARLIEEAKEKIGFTPLEELNNGFYAFLMGDILPSKKNEIVYLETKSQLETMIDQNAQEHLNEIKKQEPHSYYFYSNEKQFYEEHHYYKVIPRILGKTLDNILNPFGEIVVQRVAKNLSKEEAEKIAALSHYLSVERTEYKYYVPKEAIATDEILIFDMDFYVNQLNRYTINFAFEDDNSVFEDEVDISFFDKIRTTKEKTLQNLSSGELTDDLIKSTARKQYFEPSWRENELFYFNTYNGDDIIAAPLITQNIFDIHNGTKRLSGGEKDDTFNVFTSKSPRYASRFYGREGNDTLRIIQTEKKYIGYEVNLSKNYIKFIGGENKSNSQSFHARLFIFQEQGQIYTHKLADAMPNITLQKQPVIAYLDSIENVVGSEIGNDIIYGDQKNNYLNGMGGVDSLYGLAGDDTLVLREGYAQGGAGNDRYTILRASNTDNNVKQLETIIDEETHTEASLIQLNYTFDEITAISRRETDIVFTLKVGNDKDPDQFIEHLIALSHVYQDKNSQLLAHRYTIVTMDGFILTINENNNQPREVSYNFSYLEKYNQQEKLQQLSVNDDKHTLSIQSENKTKLIQLLPELQYSGFSSGEHLKLNLQGNSENNHYAGITAHSSIKLSRGYDNYQISSLLAKNRNEKITISLSDNDKQLTSDCTSHFFLSDVSGFDLIFSDGVLSHRYNPDAHIKLVFDTESVSAIFNSGMTLQFIDKDNRVFHLPKPDSGQRLLIPTITLDVRLSHQSDVLMIPRSLRLNKEALSLYPKYFRREELSSRSTQLQRIISTQIIEPHSLKVTELLRDDIAVNDNQPVNSILSLNKLFSNRSQDIFSQAIDLLPMIELMDGDDIVVNHNQSSSVIDGGKGDDHIVVNEGHHILIAGEGNDNLNGGSGHDLFISTSGNDYLSGGSGNNVYVVQKRHGEVTVYDEGEMSHIFVLGLSEHEKLISSQVGEDKQYRTADNQFVLTVKTNRVEKIETDPVKVIEKEQTLSMGSLATIIQQMAQFNQQQLSTMQGSDVIPSSNWSPLAVVVKHL
ncbi:TPA: RTX toxin [Proteus mirabilis]|nr:RTX toxin [Proteus mirabilis]